MTRATVPITTTTTTTATMGRGAGQKGAWARQENTWHVTGTSIGPDAHLGTY